MPATETMTATEFLALPLDRDEYGVAPCLVEGELVVTKPNIDHQETRARILVPLRHWVDAGSGRGYAIDELDVVIDDRNVYEPDLMWYAEGRRPGPGDRAPYPMPDLVAEVRSPSTWHYDVGPKKAGYERAGLPELWLVHSTERTVQVFRRSTPDAPSFDVALELTRADALESPLLPGFALPLERVFD